MAEGMSHSESIFFGIKPNPFACGRILEAAHLLALTSGLSGRFFDADTLHISVCEIGRAERLRAPLRTALTAAGEFVKQQSFSVVLDRAMGFNAPTNGYPNVLLAGAESAATLTRLRQAIFEGQLRQGLRASRSSFKPHVTVSRSSACWKFDGAIEPIEWIVEEFVLIHSHHDGNRRLHDIVGHWPMAKNE